MRTMFISLVLIWSLAQLASTQEDAATKFLPKGCGDIYKCYAPEICINVDTTNEFVNAKKIRGVMPGSEIASNCPALIRFHSYSSHNLFISIESFQETTEINSIIFLQTDSNRREKTRFSCEISATENKMIGKYKDEQRPLQDEPTGNKLKCQFSKNRRKGGSNDLNFFQVQVLDIYYFKVNTKIADNSFELKITQENDAYLDHDQLPSPFKLRCDPNIFEFTEIIDNKTIYAKVAYDRERPHPIYCKNMDNSRIEFVSKVTNKYEKVISSQCKADTFRINDDNNNFNTEDSLEIRCVAEAQYSCQYNVKRKDQQTPTYTPPTYPTKPSELKCPKDKPHLIFADGTEPIMNATFECLNYGSIQQWTVKGRQLTENDPEVYCSATVKCEIVFTISDNAVEDGYVNKEFLPKCYHEGTMKVGGEIVTNTTCDGKVGKFKYTAGGVEKEIDANTKFLCTYPTNEEEAKQKNKENHDKLTAGIAGTIGGALFIVLAGISICAFITIRKRRKDKHFLEEKFKAEKMEWGSPSEKEAIQNARKLKNKNKSAPPSSDNHNSITETWNILITFAINKFTTTAFTRPELLVFVDKPATDVTGKNMQKYTVLKPYDKKIDAQVWTNPAYLKVLESAKAKEEGAIITGLAQRKKRLEANKKQKEREAEKN